VRRQDNIRAEFPLTRWSTSPVIFGLAVGLLVGPLGLRLLEPHVVADSGVIESVGEMALLASLFCVGLRLRTPFEWRSWRMPLRLSTLTMLATATLVAAAANVLFDMSFLQALLLGAVLAPTDAVLASDIHVPTEGDHDSVPFALAAEGAITSGLAAPLVLVVLGLLGLNDTGSGALGSLTLAVVWSVCGGAVAGWLIGAAMSRWLAILDADRQGDFLEEMIVFATATLAYICALAIRTEGLLAVFTAGLALSHGGRLRPSLRKHALGPRVLRVAGRVERLASVLVMVLLGTLVAGVAFRLRIVLFALVLLALLRPLAVRCGLGGLAVPTTQRRALEWFGARGVASVYCLALAINHGLAAPFARDLADITLGVVVTSIVFSAVSALSLRRASPGTVDL
jgi:sodium/hydrogen antiporter